MKLTCCKHITYWGDFHDIVYCIHVCELNCIILDKSVWKLFLYSIHLFGDDVLEHWYTFYHTNFLKYRVMICAGSRCTLNDGCCHKRYPVSDYLLSAHCPLKPSRYSLLGYLQAQWLVSLDSLYTCMHGGHLKCLTYQPPLTDFLNIHMLLVFLSTLKATTPLVS